MGDRRSSPAGATDLPQPRAGEVGIDLTREAIPVRSAWSDEVILEFGPTGDLLFVEPSLLRFLGYDVDLDPAQGRARADHSLVHRDDLGRVIEFWSTVLAEPDGQQVLDVRVRTAAGEWKWVQLDVTNRLADPDVGAVVGDFRDIHGQREAEAELARREGRFRALLRHSEDVIAIIGPDGVLAWVSENVGQLLGIEADALTGTDALDGVHRDDRDRARRVLERVVADGGEAETVRLRVAGGPGIWRDVDIVVRNLLGDPDVGGIALTMRDVTDRVAGERERARLGEIIEATTDLVFVFDRAFELEYMNEAAQDFFLGPGETVDGFDLSGHIPDWARQRLVGEALPTLADSDVWGGEIAFLSGGEEVAVSTLLIAHRDDVGDLEYVSSITRDMTDRKELETRLAHEATHDPLTGLPNRALLMDRIDMALGRARRSGTSTALIFCDLDHFKLVNDSLGHTRGDELLIAVADRLLEAIRPGDTVARFGGDEFVVLAEELDDAEAAEAIAERLRRAVGRPLTIAQSELFVSVSVGIAVVDRDGADPEALIRDADAAMYRAKATGRGRQVVFDQGLRAEAVERLDTETALRRALDRRELRIHYQPIRDLADQRIVGYEALLRWEHPERGLLMPADFIRVAEETGLIVPIGAWVARAACGQLARWRAEGAEDIWVAVNLSARQLGGEALVADIDAAIRHVGIPPSALRVEITESLLIENVEQATATLRLLRELGVQVVVDDFGTGYSSLSYLSRFPVDVLKIDKSLMSGLGRHERDTAIVTAVVGLAHTLGLTAIGEGVEDQHQYDALRRLGCDQAQGFLLGRPRAGTEIHPERMGRPVPA
jgi:diguanylate cyclase (GGDEF)-like protein/PAS domain S-box-containing protein